MLSEGMMRSTHGGFSLGWMVAGLLLCVGPLWGKAEAGRQDPWVDTQVDQGRRVLEGSSGTSQCWVYTHLQKAGGTSVKTILKDRWKRSLVIYDAQQWDSGNEFMRQFAWNLMTDDEWQVAAGGYTEGLRSAVQGNCKWFVMFRHPVSRVVSAYYYCKKIPWDPLCASKIADPNKVSLEQFARHWGNFGVRQFVLGLVPMEEIHQFKQTLTDPDKIPGWYIMKMYLDHQGSKSGGDENTVMKGMLGDVYNLIRDQMDAVGVLEEFETTLALFDRVLQMPALNWTSSFADSGVRNGARGFYNEAALALKGVWTNEKMKRYMSLDLLLYEHALNVFHGQAQRYGLQ